MRRPEEWIELEVTVDSGACISVMPIASCEGIDIVENELSRNGAEYEVEWCNNTKPRWEEMRGYDSREFATKENYVSGCGRP